MLRGPEVIGVAQHYETRISEPVHDWLSRTDEVLVADHHQCGIWDEREVVVGQGPRRPTEAGRQCLRVVGPVRRELGEGPGEAGLFPIAVAQSIEPGLDRASGGLIVARDHVLLADATDNDAPEALRHPSDGAKQCDCAKGEADRVDDTAVGGEDVDDTLFEVGVRSGIMRLFGGTVAEEVYRDDCAIRVRQEVDPSVAAPVQVERRREAVDE